MNLSMKSNSFFRSVKPSRRSEVVADGFGYITTSVDKATLNLKQLNGWVKEMTSQIAQHGPLSDEDQARIAEALEQYRQCADGFTCAMVDNAKAIESLFKTLKIYGNNGTAVQQEQHDLR